MDTEDNYFFAVAHCFDLESGTLSDYRWSSYPGYISTWKRPAWLAVDRLFGNLCLNDNPTGRRGYRTIMQERVADICGSENKKDVDEQWHKIRRGWYFGSEEFRDSLLKKLDDMPGQRASFSGDAVRMHDEKEAEHLFLAGLNTLGLAEGDFLALRKGATEKCLLA